MKLWSEIEIVSLLCFIIAAICSVVLQNPYIHGVLFLISALLLVHIFYQNKVKSEQYKSIICHYKGILSVSEIHWCAWNVNGEFVGASSGFRNIFAIQSNGDLKIPEIIHSLQPDEAKFFAENVEKLYKNGSPFEMTVYPKNNTYKIKVIGSKIIISNVVTISLWCQDVTVLASNLLKATENWKVYKTKAEELQIILDTIPIPIWDRDKNFKIHFCNESYMRYVDSFKDKIFKDNIPLIKGNLFGQGTSLAENAQKTKRKQKIQHYTVVSGIRKKIEMYEHPMESDDSYIIGYAFDISDKEELENKLDNIIAGNNEILESLSTAVAIFGDNMRLKFFNSSYRKMTGLDESWLYSSPLYSEVLEQLRDLRQIPELTSFLEYKKAQLEIFTTLIEPKQELMFLPNGKTIRCYISTYYLGGLLFLYEDVTNALDLEREHNTLLAVQKETIDHLYEGIVVFGSNHKLQLANSSLLKIWPTINNVNLLDGMHISEFVDKIIGVLEFKELPDVLKGDLIDQMTDRNPKSVKLFTRAGKIILFSYIPLPDGSHLQSFMDVTDSYQVEQALLERNQALEISNNLRIEFISNIYSEMLKPINIMNGFLDLLSEPFYGKLTEKQQEHCGCIRTIVNNMNTSLKNIVDMASVDNETLQLDISSFDIQESILNMINLASQRAGLKQVTINTHLNTKIKDFQGDQKRILQALYNIMMNFINLSEANGQIYICTEIIKEQSQKSLKISISNYNIFSDKKTEVSKNTSCINSNLLAFGLPFARSVIEMHNGKFNIKSGNEHLLTVCILPIPRKKERVICMSEDEFNLLPIAVGNNNA